MAQRCSISLEGLEFRTVLEYSEQNMQPANSMNMIQFEVVVSLNNRQVKYKRNL